MSKFMTLSMSGENALHEYIPMILEKNSNKRAILDAGSKQCYYIVRKLGNDGKPIEPAKLEKVVFSVKDHLKKTGKDLEALPEVEKSYIKLLNASKALEDAKEPTKKGEDEIKPLAEAWLEAMQNHLATRTDLEQVNLRSDSIANLGSAVRDISAQLGFDEASFISENASTAAFGRLAHGMKEPAFKQAVEEGRTVYLGSFCYTLKDGNKNNIAGDSDNFADPRGDVTTIGIQTFARLEEAILKNMRDKHHLPENDWNIILKAGGPGGSNYTFHTIFKNKNTGEKKVIKLEMDKNDVNGIRKEAEKKDKPERATYIKSKLLEKINNAQSEELTKKSEKHEDFEKQMTAVISKVDSIQTAALQEISNTHPGEKNPVNPAMQGGVGAALDAMPHSNTNPHNKQTDLLQKTLHRSNTNTQNKNEHQAQAIKINVDRKTSSNLLKGNRLSLKTSRFGRAVKLAEQSIKNGTTRKVRAQPKNLKKLIITAFDGYLKKKGYNEKNKPTEGSSGADKVALIDDLKEKLEKCKSNDAIKGLFKSFKEAADKLNTDQNTHSDSTPSR